MSELSPQVNSELMPARGFRQLASFWSQLAEAMKTSIQPKQECARMQSVNCHFDVVLVQCKIAHRKVHKKSDTD